MLTEPFGRLLDRRNCKDPETYGKAGSQTKTVASGSIYYTFLRGHESYVTEP